MSKKLKGHKPGCGCVGCSPAARRKGMAALNRRRVGKLTRGLVKAKYMPRHKNPKRAGRPVISDARELYLFADNDADLYRQMKVPIERNLAKKIGAGKFDKALAVKGWQYFADAAAKKYTREYGTGTGFTFSVPTRKAVAAMFAREFLDKYRGKEYSDDTMKLGKGKVLNPIAIHGGKRRAYCANCGQWKSKTAAGYLDCFNECARRGFEPKRTMREEEKRTGGLGNPRHLKRRAVKKTHKRRGLHGKFPRGIRFSGRKEWRPKMGRGLRALRRQLRQGKYYGAGYPGGRKLGKREALRKTKVVQTYRIHANPAPKHGGYIGKNVALHRTTGRTETLRGSKLYCGASVFQLLIVMPSSPSMKPAIGSGVSRMDYDNRPKAIRAYGRAGRFTHPFTSRVSVKSIGRNHVGQANYNYAILESSTRLWEKQS